jgi:dipeptidyl aminopeptidase/acylaminoacyl peptidase
MKIEDRLADAMRDYADRIEPDPGSWARITARITARFDEEPTPAPRRPSRRPFVLAGMALVLVLVLITALVARDGGDKGARVVTQPSDGSVAMPSRILAVTVDGTPVVLQSSDGARLTEFREAAPVAGNGNQVATNPEGTGAYVGRGDGGLGCAGHSILRLPVGVGAPVGAQVATDATLPTVSRDGRYLAFLRCVSTPDRADEIVLRDLTSGTDQTTAAPSGRFFSSLTFAPDSRHVLLQLSEGTSKPSLHELDLVGREAAPGRTIPVGSKTLIAGYLGTTGELIGEDVTRVPAAVVALSADTGSPIHTITNFPESFGAVASDPSGRHLLLRDGQTLYRWSRGDAAPTKLSGEYSSAAWIPDTAPASPPVEPTTAPTGVLVAKRSGEMVVLGAQDGQQHSSLGQFPDVSSVSTSPDGRQVFFTSMESGTACGNNPGPVVTRLTPATGQKTRIVGGALSGRVSPDGRFIVYGIWCDGRGPGFTNLLTGENSRSDALGSKAHESSDLVETTEPLAWSPDSKLVLFRLGLKGDQKPHYYVSRLWPAVPQSETKVVALPYGSGISAATFVDDDTVALAEPSGTTTEVRRWTVATGSEELPSPVLFEVPGRVTSLVSDRTGRDFLALNQAGDLFRWSRGEDQPTKVASGVAAATWLPWS